MNIDDFRDISWRIAEYNRINNLSNAGWVGSNLIIMIELYRNNTEPQRYHDICQLHNFNPSTACRVVDKLIERGFVERVDIGKKQSGYIQLTDAGYSFADYVFNSEQQ
jgi:predicted transcriptional regulator